MNGGQMSGLVNCGQMSGAANGVECLGMCDGLLSWYPSSYRM
jgi:hypothetical protein